MGKPLIFLAKKGLLGSSGQTKGETLLNKQLQLHCKVHFLPKDPLSHTFLQLF